MRPWTASHRAARYQLRRRTSRSVRWPAAQAAPGETGSATTGRTTGASRPYGPEAVSVVRRGVRAALTTWNLPAGVADDVLPVVPELVTNALGRTTPPATLRLSRIRAGAPLRTRRGDRRRTAPPPQGVGPGARPGRARPSGIVAPLSARRGTRVGRGGVSR